MAGPGVEARPAALEQALVELQAAHRRPAAEAWGGLGPRAAGQGLAEEQLAARRELAALRGQQGAIARSKLLSQQSSWGRALTYWEAASSTTNSPTFLPARVHKRRAGAARTCGANAAGFPMARLTNGGAPASVGAGAVRVSTHPSPRVPGTPAVGTLVADPERGRADTQEESHA